MLQAVVVTLAVAVAFVYAAWAMLPGTLRHQLASWLVRALGGVEAAGARGMLAARLQRAAARATRGCSDCPANTLTPAERSARRDE
jgi:hypothetical protein